jgi:hypothetical protein
VRLLGRSAIAVRGPQCAVGECGSVAVGYALLVVVIGPLLVAACYLLVQSVGARVAGMGRCVASGVGGGHGIGNGKGTGNGKGKGKGNGSGSSGC